MSFARRYTYLDMLDHDKLLYMFKLYEKTWIPYRTIYNTFKDVFNEIN
ncbi:hypothetical protein JPSP33_18020 [Staphylococcus pseudintermedius]